MTNLLETLVNPSSGGADSCKGVTTNALQGWQSIGLKKENTGLGEGNAALKMPQMQLSVVSAENQHKNLRNEEDRILLVVPDRILGHVMRALIDSGATRNFISPADATRFGLKVESHNTFWNLVMGQRCYIEDVLSTHLLSELVIQRRQTSWPAAFCTMWILCWA